VLMHVKFELISLLITNTTLLGRNQRSDVCYGAFLAQE